jgi:NADH:ubiquinone oxidoreductase subunit F (NADH-binding)
VVVVNAAEGEPGTFKDRILLRTNPYLVLEGACIAAISIDATEIVVAVKASFAREVERLRTAIAELDAAGWTASAPIRIVEGPGEYLFGEETALLEVIEGRPPFPRVIPPYRHGLADTGGLRDLLGAPPTLVDNVESLANIPGILHHGADWYRSVGTRQSPGTILCTVTGATSIHGVGEFEMGTPLREVIDIVGGGVPDDVAAVLVGVSNPPLDGRRLDVRLTYEDLSAAGSGLGSASFIVITSEVPLRDVAAGVARFLAIESCGQCTPCKHDGLAVAQQLVAGADETARGRLATVARGARCALAGQTERVVGRLLELADERGEDAAGSATPWPITPLVDIVGGRAVDDVAHLSKRADWSFDGDEGDSHQDPVQRYADQGVVVRPAHVPEPGRRGADRPTVASPATEDPFASLHRSHARLETAIDALRTASPEGREALLHQLRDELSRHRDATARYLYPVVQRIEPEIGADVAWYPEHHEHHAQRLLERLDLAGVPAEPRLIDELCADVHASIIEIDRRVIPLLEAHLLTHREVELDADIAAELDLTR